MLINNNSQLFNKTLFVHYKQTKYEQSNKINICEKSDRNIHKQMFLLLIFRNFF